MSAAAKVLIDSARDLMTRASDFNSDVPSYDRICEGYSKLNLHPGSAVLLFAPNTREFLLHWLAVLANGLVPAAIAPSAKRSFVEDVCRSLYISAVSRPSTQQAGLDAGDSAEIGSFRAAVLQRRSPVYDPFDVLVLTTGTSGSQSACLHRVGSLVRNAEMTNRSLGITASDKQLIVLPMYHSFGLITQSIGSIISGGELLIDGPPFNSDRFCQRVRQENITVCGITPTIARDLIVKRARIPFLRSLSVGGDQISRSEVSSLLHDVAVKELYVTYGLTEAGPRISVLPAHSSPLEAFDSVGKAFPEILTKIESPDAQGVGQLLVKTPSALKRRIGSDVQSLPFDRDGFLVTGDLFKKDDDGYLRYVARSKDIVIVKGEKVNTRYVSKVAERDPSVAFARTLVDEDGTLVSHLWARDNKDLDLGLIERFMRTILRFHEVPTLMQQRSEIFHK